MTRAEELRDRADELRALGHVSTAQAYEREADALDAARDRLAQDVQRMRERDRRNFRARRP